MLYWYQKKVVYYMSKFITIGEALIDFMPSAQGRLSDIESFRKCAGGSTANAASAVAHLGVESLMISMLGKDAFGDFLVSAIAKAGVRTTALLRTDKANTGLAFVSHTADGERDFLFYRNPSADMLLSPEDIDPDWFETGDVLHFCSVALVDAPCRKAHDRAIAIAKEKGCLISFDVNLRFSLWPSADDLKETVLHYIPMADIVKVSDDELAFLGDFASSCKLITMGKHGARYITKDIDCTVKGFATPAIDTTGAGDSFIGSFLASILQAGGGLPTNERDLTRMLRYSHAAASLVVSRMGAMEVMPTPAEVDAFLAAQ